MKNFIKIATIITLIILNTKIYSQEKKVYQEPKKIGLDIPFEEKYPPVKILKEVLETRKRMREIERQTIENDPELKKEFETLLNLKKQMYEKLKEKLKDNEEYQRLKKRLEIIDKKIKEKINEERR